MNCDVCSYLHYRVPTQILFFKFPLFSLFFPCPTGNFPCAKFTNLRQLSETDFEDFVANIAISLESGNL